jgi:RNA polymerase sigma-70 factor (ECF subfamily)
VLGYLRAQRAPDPEDLLGEVFLQVTRDRHRFEGDQDAFRRWVFTIAHHRLIDERRRMARRPVVSDAELPDLPATGDVADMPTDPELLAALDQLSPDQREVVVLRFVADLSLEQVAAVTSRRVGAVKALQHRALTRLSRLMPVSPEG